MRFRSSCQAAVVLPLANVVSHSSIAQAGGAASGALATLKSLDYRYFVAGGTCAAISHGITTPIDVVKTRIQADPKKYDKGMQSAAVDILKTDGPGALLGGLGPTVVGYGVEGAMKFGVYEIMKPVFASLLSAANGNGGAIGGDDASNTAVAFLLASVVAGAIAALLLCPMESTRIRIVTDPEYADKGLLKGLPKLVAEEGLLSTFSGLWAMLSKQVPYTFGKQVSFDVFAGLLYGLAWINLGEPKWVVSVVAAFLASIVACILSQPGDMILTVTYRPRDETCPSTTLTSFPEVVGQLYRDGGLAAFFTGTGARIVHVGMIITTQLVIYDIVKQMLGLPATGSH